MRTNERLSVDNSPRSTCRVTLCGGVHVLVHTYTPECVTVACGSEYTTDVTRHLCQRKQCIEVTWNSLSFERCGFSYSDYFSFTHFPLFPISFINHSLLSLSYANVYSIRNYIYHSSPLPTHLSLPHSPTHLSLPPLVSFPPTPVVPDVSSITSVPSINWK